MAMLLSAFSVIMLLVVMDATIPMEMTSSLPSGVNDETTQFYKMQASAWNTGESVHAYAGFCRVRGYGTENYNTCDLMNKSGGGEVWSKEDCQSKLLQSQMIIDIEPFVCGTRGKNMAILEHLVVKHAICPLQSTEVSHLSDVYRVGTAHAKHQKTKPQ